MRVLSLHTCTCTCACREEIEGLASSLSFPLKKLFVVDGSKRSAHSNAYMYGFFNNKRIVLFDTLVEQCSVKEVVAVLAHELGAVLTCMVLAVLNGVVGVDWLHDDVDLNNQCYTAGHWKLRHTPVLFVVGQVVLLTQLGLFSFVRVNAEALHQSFGFAPGIAPVFVSFMLFQIIIAPVDEVCLWCFMLCS